MRRREFIPLIGSAAVAPAMLWAFDALAQQPALPVIGFLNSGWRELFTARVAAFHRGLNDTGFVVGRNVAMSINGRKVSTIVCQRSPPIWSNIR